MKDTRNLKELKKIGLRFKRESGCECCGELEPYSATLNYDCTDWCLPCCCACACDIELTDEEVKLIEQEQYRLQIKHYKNRIKELEELLE